jgi:hypothetical protein
MRILRETALCVWNADGRQETYCLLAGLFRGHAEMDLEGFGELAADRQDGIEGGHRFLEDHRDLASSNVAHRLLINGEEVPSLKQDLATNDASRRSRHQSHDAQGAH